MPRFRRDHPVASGGRFPRGVREYRRPWHPGGRKVSRGPRIYNVGTSPSGRFFYGACENHRLESLRAARGLEGTLLECPRRKIQTSQKTEAEEG